MTSEKEHYKQLMFDFVEEALKEQKKQSNYEASKAFAMDELGEMKKNYEYFVDSCSHLILFNEFYDNTKVFKEMDAFFQKTENLIQRDRVNYENPIDNDREKKFQKSRLELLKKIGMYYLSSSENKK